MSDGLPDSADIEAALPPPRDTDPSGLRSDIADELADHLACALARESAAADPVASVRRRFGDPYAVAARLYFDAIKGTVLMQKLTLGLSAASLLLVAVAVWQSITAVAAVRQSSNQSTIAYQELTETLEELQVQVQAAQPSDAFVDIRLHVKSETGQPLSGFDVRLNRKGNDWAASGVSDASGVSIQERVPGGMYTISASHPSGWRFNGQLAIEPGQPRLLDLIAPNPEAAATLTLENKLRPEAVPQSAFHFAKESDDLGDGLSIEAVGISFDVSTQRELSFAGQPVTWYWNLSGGLKPRQLVVTSDAAGARVLPLSAFSYEKSSSTGFYGGRAAGLSGTTAEVTVDFSAGEQVTQYDVPAGIIILNKTMVFASPQKERLSSKEQTWYVEAVSRDELFGSRNFGLDTRLKFHRQLTLAAGEQAVVEVSLDANREQA